MWGRALVAQGQVDDGIAQLQQGLTFLQATGTPIARVGHLAWLAAAYASGGRIEEGLGVLAEAQTFIEHTGARIYEGSVYITRGRLLFARSEEDHAEAEACFRHVLTLAHRQSAKAVELLAAMNLSRLWQYQGKKTAARQLLAEIYGWFTEGFDTVDLKEAKGLLDELTSEDAACSPSIRRWNGVLRCVVIERGTILIVPASL